MIKHAVQKALNTFGYQISRRAPRPPQDENDMPIVGSDYTDPAGVIPCLRLKHGEPKPYADHPVIFEVNNGKSTITEEVLYSHLTLLKMLKCFDFHTVLDIGSHQRRVTRVFEHLGKETTTVEPAPGYEADYKKDYLEVTFPRKFDAIWCSQTLEHQRNVGQFVDKLFDDLADGGVLALTVPYDVGPHLNFGHCNQFTPYVVLYHLVLSGFDCSRASLLVYNHNIGIVLKKKYNGVRRHLRWAALPDTPDKNESVVMDGKQVLIRDIIADEISPGIDSSFPLPVRSNNLPFSSHRFNWGDPI